MIKVISQEKEVGYIGRIILVTIHITQITQKKKSLDTKDKIWMMIAKSVHSIVKEDRENSLS